MALPPHHLVVLSSGSACRLRPWSDTHTKTLLPTCDGPLLAQLGVALGQEAESTVVVSQVPRLSTAEMLRREVSAAAPAAELHVVGLSGRDPWTDVYRLLQRLGSTAYVVLVNGDLVLDRGWAAVVRTALLEGQTTLCAQRPDGRGHAFGVLSFSEGGDVYTADSGDRSVEAIGMSILAPGILTGIAAELAVGVNPWFEVVLPLLARSARLRVAVHDLPWTDVGSWPSLLRWEATRHGHAPSHASDYGCRMGEVGPGTVLLGSVVMAGGRVGAGCRLEEVVVLPGGVVGDDVSLRRAVVGEGGLVSAIP